MPSLTFVLPEWLYWAGLVFFPIFAMAMARRQAKVSAEERRRRHSLSIAYLVLITGGIVGLHRFYLKSLIGLIYIPVFVFILYANAEQRDARGHQSDAINRVEQAQSVLERDGKRVAEAERTLADLRAEAEAAEEGSFAKTAAERRLKRAETRIASARHRVTEAEAELAEAEPLVEETTADRHFWDDAAYYGLLVILVFMVFDAVRMPAMKRRADALIAGEAEAAAEVRIEEQEEEALKADYDHVSQGWTGWIDRLSYYSGEFVSFWAVIAVFVYYYEVVARYVFNSPTNWAHEGMFLMFGMQYLISGAYALLAEGHVRVDVFYATMAPRRKALVDILTSVFFFIFAGTLLVTGWIFAVDATVVREVSFTEWGIAYWPFKWFIFIGALLLVLQGVSKMAKDIRLLINGGEPAAPGA